MHDRPSHHPVSLGLVAGLSVLVVATGSAVAWWTWNATVQRVPPAAKVEPSPLPASPESQPESPDSRIPAIAPSAKAQKSEPPAAPITAEKTLQVYWLKSADSKIELAATPVKLSSTGDSEAVLQATIEKLLAGSTNPTLTTAIPRGTQLRQISVDRTGIHLDLSREFQQGGGSASMTGRVAQVLYTVTSLNPQASVWFSVEGKPLETLGGEGLIIDQPITRASFERDFSL
jgi:spore germination protein GerM